MNAATALAVACRGMDSHLEDVRQLSGQRLPPEVAAMLRAALRDYIDRLTEIEHRHFSGVAA